MSITKELKTYLIEKENAFLLNDDNNGKTIMLSGAWGAGKTHFWEKEIEPNLFKKLKAKNKSCVYVSLYGKDNIQALRSEILFKAYESIKEENKLKKKAVSAFGVGSRAFSFSAFGFKLNTKELAEKLELYDEEKKIEEAESFLENGAVICLDDFERKSKKIDLNDLFGFISQLSIEMNCKVIIILNADVFTGEEAEVFKTVKEKTINKFFYFEPTIEELFESISKDKKYDALNDYKNDILNAIKETEELNARIYIQVLDNCLEWLKVKKNLDEKIVRVLVLGTFNFVLNHIVFKCKLVQVDENITQRMFENFKSLNSQSIEYSYPKKIIDRLQINIKLKNNQEYPEFYDSIKDDYKNKDFINLVIKNIKNNLNQEIKKNTDFYINYVYEHQNIIKSLSFLNIFHIYHQDIEYKDTFNEIANFIESGILT